jgi:hypothetical protein
MFGRVQGLREIPTRVILAILIGLKEHTSSSDKGSISNNSELPSRIWVLENQLSKEAIFQGKERVITHIRPREVGILLRKIN